LSRSTICGHALSVWPNLHRLTCRKPALSASSRARSQVNGVRVEPYQIAWTMSLPPIEATSSSPM
jgi:hypothetical protein